MLPHFAKMLPCSFLQSKKKSSEKGPRWPE